MFEKIFSSNKKSSNSYSLNNISDLFPTSIAGGGIKSYKDNVIVHKCVNLIAATASHVPWKVYKTNGHKSMLIPSHPALSILKKPNNRQSGADFFIEMLSNLLLYGNAYILAITHDNYIHQELFLLEDANMEVIVKNGKILGYKYKYLDREEIYAINQLNYKCKILHLKTYNPTDKIYGSAPLLAASTSIEIHNFASQWNISLLKNGARPSGALILKDPNHFLTEEQFIRLKDQFIEQYSGNNKVGKPLLLEGGLDWRDMSINPKDMDFIELKNLAAREIAMAFGVPPQLLGINGDNTYSNMKEARLALWEETIIPLLDKISDNFSNYFSNLYGEDLMIDFDRDEISALTGRREDLWARIASCDFISINEKRAFIGLPPLEGRGGDNIDG